MSNTDNNTAGWRTVPISRRTLLSTVSGVALGTALPVGTATADDDSDNATVGPLTPRPATAGDGYVRSLNGTWDFTLASSIDDQSNEWREEEVPGQWGYDDGGPDEWYPPEGQLGWYRRELEAPEGDGERFILRFDAVYSEAWVYLNGAEVGHHVGGYTPFEIDVTDHVEEGTNVLSVGVAQASASDDMAWGNVTGGIPRDVSLVSVPEVHVADYDVHTYLEGSSATVDIETRVENASGAAVDATLEVTLSDPSGETVATAERSLVSLTGDSWEPSMTLNVTDPKTWNPEDPQLYTLELDLHARGSTERVTQRVGIREVEVVGNELRLNGEAVTLRGVNWEEIHLPAHGYAVPSELTREDARRLKEANINYVRTAHHPTSEAFLEACDELGLVVEVEAPHTFVGRGRELHPEVAISQTVETVERDKNRTSVCLWSIANESEWYDAFETAGQLTKEIDPTRPTIFNYDNYDPDDPWHDVFDLRSQHYPELRSGSTIDEYDGIDEPIMFGEYAHTYCYNGRELTTDPGLRDQWGIPMERLWELCRAGDSVAGAAIWAGGDHLEQWGEYLWGLLDRHRRPRPEYWHVKKTYSPVQVVETEWLGNGNALRLTIENQHEFVDLADRSIEFEGARSSGNRPIEAAPGERVTLTVPVADDRLELKVTHPRGHTIEHAVFTADSPESRSDLAPTGTVLETDEEMVWTTEGVQLSVDRNTGNVEILPEDRQGPPVVVGGPELALSPTESEAEGGGATIDHRLDDRTVTDVRIVEDGEAVAIDVEYAIATGMFVLRPLDGGVEVEYEFTLEEALDIREAGIALPVRDDLTTLSWRRESQWSTYPDDHIGRTEGTAVAFPSGTRPDHEDIRLYSDRLWKDDATSHGSNDFRGTKRNIYTATLVDDDGTGVHVHSDGDHHVRAQVRSESVDLLALDRSLSGTNPFDWMNRQPLLGEEPTIEAGETASGSATFEISGSN